MTTAYSAWQQSVDGPDELSREDQVQDGMFRLYARYSMGELIEKLGFSRIVVLGAFENGHAPDGFIAAMNKLANEGVELEAPVLIDGPIEF